ncbi:MAG: signal peptidase I [Clostridiales bacterium]|jgi:signal peptidase|nr:signal peptidase I [Clostridiales bacterium]
MAKALNELNHELQTEFSQEPTLDPSKFPEPYPSFTILKAGSDQLRDAQNDKNAGQRSPDAPVTKSSASSMYDMESAKPFILDLYKPIPTPTPPQDLFPPRPAPNFLQSSQQKSEDIKQIQLDPPRFPTAIELFAQTEAQFPKELPAPPGPKPQNYYQPEASKPLKDLNAKPLSKDFYSTATSAKPLAPGFYSPATDYISSSFPPPAAETYKTPAAPKASYKPGDYYEALQRQKMQAQRAEPPAQETPKALQFAPEPSKSPLYEPPKAATYEPPKMTTYEPLKITPYEPLKIETHESPKAASYEPPASPPSAPESPFAQYFLDLRKIAPYTPEIPPQTQQTPEANPALSARAPEAKAQSSPYMPDVKPSPQTYIPEAKVLHNPYAPGLTPPYTSEYSAKPSGGNFYSAKPGSQENAQMPARGFPLEASSFPAEAQNYFNAQQTYNPSSGGMKAASPTEAQLNDAYMATAARLQQSGYRAPDPQNGYGRQNLQDYAPSRQGIPEYTPSRQESEGYAQPRQGIPEYTPPRQESEGYAQPRQSDPEYMLPASQDSQPRMPAFDYSRPKQASQDSQPRMPAFDYSRPKQASQDSQPRMPAFDYSRPKQASQDSQPRMPAFDYSRPKQASQDSQPRMPAFDYGQTRQEKRPVASYTQSKQPHEEPQKAFANDEPISKQTSADYAPRQTNQDDPPQTQDFAQLRQASQEFANRQTAQSPLKPPHEYVQSLTRPTTQSGVRPSQSQPGYALAAPSQAAGAKPVQGKQNGKISRVQKTRHNGKTAQNQVGAAPASSYQNTANPYGPSVFSNPNAFSRVGAQNLSIFSAGENQKYLEEQHSEGHDPYMPPQQNGQPSYEQVQNLTQPSGRAYQNIRDPDSQDNHVLPENQARYPAPKSKEHYASAKNQERHPSTRSQGSHPFPKSQSGASQHADDGASERFDVSAINRSFLENPDVVPHTVDPSRKKSYPKASSKQQPYSGKREASKQAPGNKAVQKRPPAKIEDGAKKKRPITVWTRVSDAIFYLALVLMVGAAVYYNTRENGPIVLFKHSIMTVLTTSMQSVYPKGSLVVLKEVDPDTLVEGDDITYMKDQSTSVTHRIQEIFENYENTGARGFQTYGVNNGAPDQGIVPAIHVRGKVIFHIPKLGMVIAYVGDNIVLLVGMFGLLLILSFLVRGLFKNDDLQSGKSPGSIKKRKSSEAYS